MNLNVIYDLRDCLHMNFVAGSDTIDDDMRLKKAIENLRVLRSVAPIFAKLVSECDALLTTKKEEKVFKLIDTITLVDAIICTMDSCTIKEEVNELVADDLFENEIMVENIPYSVLRDIIAQLTNMYCQNSIESICTDKLDYLLDYRIINYFINSINSTNYSLPQESFRYILKSDKEIFIKLIKRDFDKQSYSVMKKRLELIMKKEGADANEFYLEMYKKLKGKICVDLVEALHFSEENIDLLLSICSSKRKNLSLAAADALSYFSLPKIDEYAKEIAIAEPQKAICILKSKNTEFAKKIYINIFNHEFNTLLNEIEKCDSGEESTILKITFYNVINAIGAMLNSNSLQCFDCIVLCIEHFEKLNQYFNKEYLIDTFNYNKKYFTLPNVSYNNFAKLMEDIFMSSIKDFDNEKVVSKIIKIYENTKYDFLIPFVFLAKVFDGSFSKDWLDLQINNLSKDKKKKSINEILDLLLRFRGSDNGKVSFIKDEEIVNCSFYDIDIPVVEIFEWSIEYFDDYDFEDFYLNVFDYYLQSSDLNKKDYDLKERLIEKYKKLLKKDQCRLCTNYGFFGLIKRLNINCDGLGVYYYMQHDFSCVDHIVEKLFVSKQEKIEEYDRIKLYINEHSDRYDDHDLKRIDDVQQRLNKE